MAPPLHRGPPLNWPTPLGRSRCIAKDHTQSAGVAAHAAEREGATSSQIGDEVLFDLVDECGDGAVGSWRGLSETFAAGLLAIVASQS